VTYIGPVRRWDIYWAHLNPSIGSEQGGRARPVIIVSNDGINSAFDVVTMVPLTKLEGKTRKVYPFEALLPKGTITPNWGSIVMIQQVRAISKKRLLKPIGKLTREAHRTAIERRLLEHFDISFKGGRDP
jgi:mRNA interferase MazF